MPTERTESQSRRLLGRLRDTMSEGSAGQVRLDRITRLIAESMQTEVCSLYLLRDSDTLELASTWGLHAGSVHKTRLRIGEGLVGRVARGAQPVNTANAPAERGFRYMPETGEERFSSFLGVPIQRLGEILGVLVVQSKEARLFSDDEIYGLDVVAMVLAEMNELGALDGAVEGPRARHSHAVTFRGQSGQEGAADGHVWLHEPRVVVTRPVTDDPEAERARLARAVDALRLHVDDLLANTQTADADGREVLEAYRMFAQSRSWIRRMDEDIGRGLSAEAAVEKEQSVARARMAQVQDAYLHERLSDLDDLSNRLLRILTGQGRDTGARMPPDPILVARNIGPGELLDYGRQLRGIVLEQGSVGSHAGVVARALAIPLVIQAEGITFEALNGDRILIDGDRGIAHLRPGEKVAKAFQDKIAMLAAAKSSYASLRDLPAEDRSGIRIALHMNAGLIADLPSLPSSGAEGVGLFRTELQFLIRNRMPRRSELVALYERVMAAAQGRRVVFRTLDIGSDKVMPYMKRPNEPNPAMGWRAVRVGLDKKGVMRMQAQALIRAAAGRPLTVMFPLIAEAGEFFAARALILAELERERHLGHVLPERLEIGAMLETPALAFAPRCFFEAADFISVGGNDLKQFFFAADRENELVRRRYDTLDLAYLRFLRLILARCAETGTPLSFCGEDAGRPIEALTLAALGFRALSMRPASIGPVKALLRQADLTALAAQIAGAEAEAACPGRAAGTTSLRPLVRAFIAALPELSVDLRPSHP